MSENVNDIVIVRHYDDVAVVELATPRNRNALTVAMRETLADRLEAAHADSAVRAIVITGAGGDFCSGGDMKRDPDIEAEPPSTRTPRLLEMLHRIVREITCGPTPVLAAVDGNAFGAGLSLAAACDYVVAGPTARFSAAFARVGLFPDAGLAWSLPNRVGAARARRMVLSAEIVGAEAAMQSGLVDEVAPIGETLARAIARARDFTCVAPLAAAHIRAVMGVAPLDMEAAFACEMRIQPILTASDDYAEARSAFSDKRKARFNGN